MIDNFPHAAILFAILPLVAVVGLSLNLFIRARGGRAFSLQLKGFGVDLRIDTSSTLPQEKKNEDTNERL